MGYQSDSVSKETKSIENTQEILEVKPEHLGPSLLHSPVRNRYSVINANLVVGKDIRLRARNAKQLEIAGWQVSLPAPLVTDQSDYYGLCQTEKGNTFNYAIDADGRLFLYGTFVDSEDHVILNVNPYLAELPLRYVNFRNGGGEFVVPRDEPKPTDEF
ncbi:hypothetical protein A9Q93_12480 [Nonlabens dokdonensis]|uniref:Uncharacterized protein n=1 Tax=Nonlabens dokdonensis TaxID=328515 RepID=A0A1Z8AKI1_9FLAO|nr:hypothetical protein [Nonlabens dokdonensis]OUS10803.1 hypothetical protein A9Q93_12480 [Nonlabens dokdonensis]